mmetsp:Transcript_25552/g.36652  ORF Transcript_25552/g.36652 Transcript_25552/m.36652 type:complete len:416 (-) Transcript_25552:218-1465(-)
MKPWPSPYILMVDRGGCTFVQKVRNAQRSGAAAVIIADDTCMCSAGDKCKSNTGVECETREPVMADDGSGSDITIPSMLLFKQDADVIKTALKANTSVQLEMAWALPNPNKVVEYSLWSTPSDTIAKEFLTLFGETAAALGTRAVFTPRMYLYDGILSNCQGPDGQNECYNLCTNNGRYCATDPDNNLDEGISGADVIKESLRRICIWQEYGLPNGVGEEWWKYSEIFIEKCDTATSFMDESCVQEVYGLSDIDGRVIEQCMTESGGLEGNKKNTLLDAELAAKQSSGVVIIPAVFVNGAVIRGGLTFKTVFQAVCAGFHEGTAPTVCQKCVPCPEEFQCTLDGYCASQSSGVSHELFLGAMIGMALLFALVLLVQYRRSKLQIRQQVRGIIAEYMPLDEEHKDVDWDEKDTQIT